MKHLILQSSIRTAIQLNTISALFILLVIAIPSGLAQNPEPKVLELKLKSNGDYDFAGTDFLRQALRNADIILLGEPYHHPKYYPFKIQLVKYLHDQLGFGVIAFESGLFQMDMVNTDIKNGDDISSAFEKGLFPIWTLTYEFEELYPYLDSLKKEGFPMEIAGFDCQISSSNASKRFVPKTERASKEHHIAVAESLADSSIAI